jgi:hypothetical protein
MSWATSSGFSPEREVEGKARTRVSAGPLHTLRSFSFRDPAGVRTHPGVPDLYVYRGLVSFHGGPVLLGCGVFPCHVTPFGLPIRWGQARSSVWLRDVALVRSLHVVGEGTPDFGYQQALSSAWLGDVAWVRCLHAVGEGTPDLGYRQSQRRSSLSRKGV